MLRSISMEILTKQSFTRENKEKQIIMKKLSVIFVMLMATTMVLAQNNNSAMVHQNSSGNEASVTQQGNRNEALITQIGEGNHTAVVNQVSNKNEVVEVNQRSKGNTAHVTQDGGEFNLVKTVLQESSKNDVMIAQTGNHNEVGKIVQTLGDWSSVIVDQTGNHNQVEHKSNGQVMQQGSGDEFFVWQNGNSNQVTMIDQVNMGGSKGQNKLTAVQGDQVVKSNNAYLEGDQMGHHNWTDARQDGNNQSASFLQKGEHNFLGIYQHGNSNKAVYNMPLDYGHSGVTHEESTVGHSVNHVKAESYQDGVVNTASMTIKNDYNDLNIFQNGNSNVGDIIIDGTGNGWGNNRTINITQTGNNNSGAINITGTSNSAVIVQGASGPMLTP